MWSLGAVVSQGQNIMAYSTPMVNSQKRHFSVHTTHILPGVPIAPGKAFVNPNFVNKVHPVVPNHQNNFNCFGLGFDRTETKNSSQKNHIIIDTIIETRPDIIPNNQEEDVKLPVESNMCNKVTKKCKKDRDKRKIPSKNSRQNRYRQELSEMMELDHETIVPDLVLEHTYTPNCSQNCIQNPCKLSDFIIGKLSPIPTEIVSTNNSPAKAEFINSPIVTSCVYDGMDNGSKLSQSESEDSFICFEDKNEVAKSRRHCFRQPSLCESEDSFIIFDDFCEDDDAESGSSSSNCTDEESETDAEYEEERPEKESKGDSKSIHIRNTKKVKFADDKLCEVHPMIKWSYAYQAARKGPWEEYARDRERFKNRISNTACKLNHVFAPLHRDRIFKERFEEIDL